MELTFLGATGTVTGSKYLLRWGGTSLLVDCGEILEWLRGFKRAPRRTFVTHGEPAAADEMRRRIEETPGWAVSVPEYGEKAVLTK